MVKKIIYLFIYLFIWEITNPVTAGLTRINAQEGVKKGRQVRRAKKRKGVEAQRAKYPTPTPVIIDELIGEEEQNE